MDQGIFLVVPVLPGKTRPADSRDFMQELEGDRKAGYQPSERRLAVARRWLAVGAGTSRGGAGAARCRPGSARSAAGSSRAGSGCSGVADTVAVRALLS